MTGSTLLTPLIGLSIALLRATLRVELLNSQHFTELQARRVPILFALWHGRMFLAIGHPVEKLRRVRIGFLEDKKLSLGSWRFLTEEEVDRFKREAKMGPQRN